MVGFRDCGACCGVWDISAGPSGGGDAGSSLAVVFVALSDCSDGEVLVVDQCLMMVKRGPVGVDCMVL